MIPSPCTPVYWKSYQGKVRTVLAKQGPTATIILKLMTEAPSPDLKLEDMVLVPGLKQAVDRLDGGEMVILQVLSPTPHQPNLLPEAGLILVGLCCLDQEKVPGRMLSTVQRRVFEIEFDKQFKELFGDDQATRDAAGAAMMPWEDLMGRLVPGDTSDQVKSWLRENQSHYAEQIEIRRSELQNQEEC